MYAWFKIANQYLIILPVGYISNYSLFNFPIYNELSYLIMNDVLDKMNEKADIL